MVKERPGQKKRGQKKKKEREKEKKREKKREKKEKKEKKIRYRYNNKNNEEKKRNGRWELYKGRDCQSVRWAAGSRWELRGKARAADRHAQTALEPVWLPPENNDKFRKRPEERAAREACRDTTA